MALDLPYELRDPIHGLIRLTEQERGIIDTLAFQRLRRIRQLAMADLVYPGAVHTRFEHSLGTMHVAYRILTHLDRLEHLSNDELVTIRLAALLHDIGHGPFSHVSEYLLDQHYNQKKVKPAKEKIHEQVTVDIIENDEQLRNLIPEDQRRQVIQLIKGATLRNYRHDVISSSLDADKMDYLLRDTYYAGVQYGRFDLDKVIESCRVIPGGYSETLLAIDEEGIFAVEQLILAKWYMTQQVYAHRVRTITDLMIVRGLELAIEDGNKDIKQLYSYDGSPSYLANYLTFDDARVFAVLLRSKQIRAKSIFKRLRERRLYNEIALIPLDEASVPNAVVRSVLVSLDLYPKSQRLLESKIAETLACEPWEVIVYKKSIKNPAYQPPGALNPEAIHVKSRDGTPKFLYQYPQETVSAKLPLTERMHIVGPLSIGENLPRAERQRQLKEWERKVTEILYDYVGGQQ